MKALLFCQNAEESAMLSLILQQSGFSVRAMRDLERAIEEFPENPFDFILAAFSEDALKTQKQAKQLRASNAVPILAICDYTSEDHLVNLLETGVDWVIPRPYSVRVLLAQVRNMMRRTANIPYFGLPILTQAGVTLDPAKRTVRAGDQAESHLTQLEFRLLYTLMTHAGQIIPAENLVESVWGYSGTGSRDLVRGLVQRLRAKVEADPRNPRYILTEAGIGYFFNRYKEES